jgi:hypothetical protein
VIDETVAAVLCREVGAERSPIADGTFRSARRMIRNAWPAEHVEWSEAEIAHADLALLRSLLHG